MTQGRKPKPANLKLIQGTNQKCRIREDAPEFDLVDNFPDAPKCLDINGLEMWNNISIQLVSARVLQVVDVYVLEQLCFFWQTFRKQANAGIVMTAADNNAMKGLFSELGMTPASRSKVQSGDKVKSGNKFASNGMKPKN